LFGDKTAFKLAFQTPIANLDRAKKPPAAIGWFNRVLPPPAFTARCRAMVKRV
jgi:hypothetical protein